MTGMTSLTGRIEQSGVSAHVLQPLAARVAPVEQRLELRPRCVVRHVLPEAARLLEAVHLRAGHRRVLHRRYDATVRWKHTWRG